MIAFVATGHPPVRRSPLRMLLALLATLAVVFGVGASPSMATTSLRSVAIYGYDSASQHAPGLAFGHVVAHRATSSHSVLIVSRQSSISSIISRRRWGTKMGSPDVFCGSDRAELKERHAVPEYGIQFGYHDAAGGDADGRARVYKDWRGRWIDEGMPWRSAKAEPPPEGWDLASQLKRLTEV